MATPTCGLLVCACPYFLCISFLVRCFRDDTTWLREDSYSIQKKTLFESPTTT
ncbi:unnamed protein product [Leptidea sinapis]|uniref:Uncharacterized protein n=1 Tax=Leptidea sinapis TaxID=189913 RepID=A0A5E4R6Z3_9NEOP|nr:unnamed protein product [Leptidea sinapis]